MVLWLIKRILKTLILLLYFLIFYYIFYNLILNNQIISCLPSNIKIKKNFLKSLFFNGKEIFIYEDISLESAHEIMHCFNNSQIDLTKSIMYTYKELLNRKLPYYCSLYHPNLNLNNSIPNFNVFYPNIHINLPLSTRNFNNCHLLGNENILGKNSLQYISKNIYLYEKPKLIEFIYEEKESVEYIKKNDNKILKHIDNVKSFYFKKK